MMDATVPTPKNAGSVASLQCHTQSLHQKLMRLRFASHGSNSLANVTQKCDRLIA